MHFGRNTDLEIVNRRTHVLAEAQSFQSCKIPLLFGGVCEIGLMNCKFSFKNRMGLIFFSFYILETFLELTRDAQAYELQSRESLN